MLRMAVRQGAVGVSRSCSQPFILLQVDDCSLDVSARAVLTLEEAKNLIEELNEQIELIEGK